VSESTIRPIPEGGVVEPESELSLDLAAEAYLQDNKNKAILNELKSLDSRTNKAKAKLIKWWKS
jgi:hypothetical protein